LGTQCRDKRIHTPSEIAPSIGVELQGFAGLRGPIRCELAQVCGRFLELRSEYVFECCARTWRSPAS
jgi:hypothetical protein